MDVVCYLNLLTERVLVPTDIERARRILQEYDAAVKEGKGAYGMAGDANSKPTMIDAPMILQAQRMLEKAKSFHLA